MDSLPPSVNRLYAYFWLQTPPAPWWFQEGRRVTARRCCYNLAGAYHATGRLADSEACADALATSSPGSLSAPSRPCGPCRDRAAGCVGDDIEQVERTLHPGEELVWQETTRGERTGLIIRPPAGKQQWIVFFYGIGMTVAGTWPVRRWLGSAGYGVACVEYAGFGVSSGSPSEYGCYRSADAAITYLQRQASIPLDQVTLIGWSLGSTVAIDVARRRDVRAQILLSPMTSLLACAIDLTRIGKTSFAIGPFDALSRARSVNCRTLIISGSEDALTRPWMANELTKAMGGHAQMVSLPGVGHNNMLRSGERLWNVVKDFLNSAE